MDLEPAEPPPRSLPAGYRVELFSQSDVGDQAVVDLWLREAELDRDEAKRRLQEVLVVVRGPDGELVAVSTAYLQHNRQLRMDLWYERIFVAEAHRRSNAGVMAVTRAGEYIVERYLNGEDPRGSGIAWEIENPELQRGLPAPVWDGPLYFIGTNARGDHVRVYFFPGALAPAP